MVKYLLVTVLIALSSVIVVEQVKAQAPAASSFGALSSYAAPRRPLVFSTFRITGQQAVTLNGVAEQFSRIIVQGGRETVFAMTNERGFFTVRVKLVFNQMNTLWFWCYDQNDQPSPPTKVEIVQDSEAPEPPELEETVPETDEDEVEIRGYAEANSTILIRGGAYEVWKLADDEGLFTITVPLQLGQDNQLMVKSVDNAFNSSPVVSVTVRQTGQETTTRFKIDVERVYEDQ
jgi:Bacterial Ig domain